MDFERKYAFNLQWRAVIIRSGFVVGLAILLAHWAKNFIGVVFVCLLGLSVFFAILACIMIIQRLFLHRILELSEDAVLLPRGFLTTRIVRVHYADIVRMWETNIGGHSGFSMVTGRGRFEIGTSRLPNIHDYNAVRDFIAAKVSNAIPSHVATPGSVVNPLRNFPVPILRWREPDDWPRYRTFLFTSKPLFSRVAKAFWFCVRCFGILVLPWLILRLCGIPTSRTLEYLSLALAVTLFFTLLHWLNASHPVHATEISFRNNGVTQFFGKQIMDHNYSQFSGWTVVERRFEGRILLILLLQLGTWDRAFALPDTNVRDRITQIFHEKKIPQIPNLTPPWE